MPRTTERDTRPRSIVTAVVLASLLVTPTLFGESETVNRIVLRVNDEIMTLHDYQKRKDSDVDAILSNPQISADDRQQLLSQLGSRIMQDMFRELLLMSRAKQLRIFVSDEEVEAGIQQMAKDRDIPDTATLERALAASNMTMDQLRERVRREILWSQVVGREVTSQIQVGEEELRGYYRSNKEEFKTPEKRWLKEVIVLESSGKSAEELAELAAEIRTALQSGGEFEAVIEPYRSEGLTTGVIDLDWLRPNELDSALADVAFQIEPGAYSEPVASRGGLHILHLAGLEEAKLLPFEEVQMAILNRERSRRFDQELRNYMGELERTAYIQEDLPPEAVGYRNLAGDYVPEQEIQLFQQPELPAEEAAAEGESTE